MKEIDLPVILSGHMAMKLLPKKAKNIAKFLESQGIKGRRKNDGRCPLAKWFQMCGHPNASVSRKFVYGLHACQTLHITTGMNKFVRRFDKRKYPNLIE